MCSSSGGECYGTAILTYLYPLLTLDTLQATGADDFVIPPDDPIWETLNGIEPTAIEPFDSTLPNNQGIQALNACASEALYHHQLYLSSVPDISLLSSSPPGPLTSLASAAGPAMAPDLSMASTATLGRSLVVARPPARQSQPPARRLKPSPKQELATRRDFSADSAEYAIVMIRRGLRGRQSSGSRGMMIHRPHTLPEADPRSLKGSRTSNTAMKEPRKSKHGLHGSPGGVMRKRTQRSSPAAIQAGGSANPEHQQSLLAAINSSSRATNGVGTAMYRTQPSPLRYEIDDPERLLKDAWPADRLASFTWDGCVMWACHPWERPAGSGCHLFPAEIVL